MEVVGLMKLKILPTHLREKKRYLAFEVFSEIPLERDDIIHVVQEASNDLYGAYGASKLNLWVLKIWKCSTTNQNIIRGILRCNRDEIESTRALIPTITRFRGKRVVFQTLGISGTINGAITNFIKLKASDD